MRRRKLLLGCCVGTATATATPTVAFVFDGRRRPASRITHRPTGPTPSILTSVSARKDDTTEDSIIRKTSGYTDSSVTSKGLVTVLTDLVNWVGGTNALRSTVLPDPTQSRPAPTRPSDLLERIRADYVDKNYLWTGDIDLACFDPHCRFTDPTLSFEGTATFVRNIRNLRPIVDALVVPPDGHCRSELLEIEQRDAVDVNDSDGQGYIETRWNMVGVLNQLPWRPKIDVIGRTQFWYRPCRDNRDDTALHVYRYDEEWEIPAGRALLQLVTPANTVPNTTRGVRLD
jgi:hypothetical protein